MNRKVRTLFVSVCLMLTAATASPQTWSDRFVWVFGWSLSKDSDVAEITQLLETSAKSGLNGAIFSLGFDSLCKHDDAYFRCLGEIDAACKRLNLELIPTIFSIGYGGGILGHNRNLAEGIPVVDAPFVVADGRATFEPDPSIKMLNGDFEQTKNTNSFIGYGFHDDPGTVSFADTQVFHGGRTSLRMENFTSNQHGHGRIMQTVKVKPHRSYRVSLWIKTEGLQPTSAFNISVLVGDRQLAPRSYDLASTGDWKKLVLIFNSLDFDSGWTTGPSKRSARSISFAAPARPSPSAPKTARRPTKRAATSPSSSTPSTTPTVSPTAPRRPSSWRPTPASNPASVSKSVGTIPCSFTIHK
jgi:hypothetical protein